MEDDTFPRGPLPAHRRTAGLRDGPVEAPPSADAERDARQARILRAMDDGYFLAEVIFDEEGRPADILYLDENPAAVRMVGRSFKGRRLRAIDPGYEPYWYEIFGRVARTGRGERLERYAAPEGKWYDFHVFKPGAEGHQVAVVFRDVTERRERESRAGERLQRQTRLLEGIASTTPDFVYVFDLCGRFLYANRRLLEVWGMSFPHVIGKTCRELGYEQWHHDMHMREIAQVIATKRPIKGEVPFRAPLTGVFGVYEYIFTPVIGPDGEVEVIAGTTRDVTERKLAEEEQVKIQQTLSEANRQKDELLAMLAHELRNPLAPIRTSAGILRARASADPVLARCRDVIERQTAQMTRLLDDLLDISRLSRGKLTLQRAPVLLHDVLEAAIETSRPLIDQAGHRLTVDAAGSGALLDGDAARLTQVFANLLNNAAKYSHPGAHIDLSVRREEDRVVVRVRDTGIGIAPEMLDRVFNLFAQGSEARAHAPGGLGIGLSLARRLVEMHGGSIAVASAGAGRGSEFTVSLPALAPCPRVDVAEGGRSASPVPRRRVLIVDDNVDAADSTSLFLETLGCDVRAVYGGEEGVREAERFRPEIVLMDIGMPGVDGHEACRRIRGAPWGAGMLLVAASGWGQKEDRQRSAQAGFDAHLVKPVDPDALVRLLRDLAPG